MILFGVFGYIFLDNGFNTKTKIKVEYKDSSNVTYKVNYLDSEYNTFNDRYVANMVNYIDIDYNYNNVLSENISGYYKYNVEGYLIAYEEDMNDSLWERKYEIVSDKTQVIDKNDINNIKINDSFIVDFKIYRDEINKFINDSQIDVHGYFHIRINILEFLNFDSLDNEYAENKVITIDIPLTDDVFEINVNNIEEKDNYYEFSNKKAINVLFIIIGVFCLSASLASVVLVISQFKHIYNKQNEYNRELKKILSKYDDCIVKVNRLYVKRKYNLIYVDSFDELMDVYYKVNKMISFKETKRVSESIFVIIDEDNAWIYKLM